MSHIERLGEVPGRSFSGVETHAMVGKHLRRYNTASLVALVLKQWANPQGDKLTQLRSAPWLSMLLVKWALLEPNMRLGGGTPMPAPVYDMLRQRLWEADRLRAGEANLHAFMRALTHVQLEFQQKLGRDFMRWPALVAPLPENSVLRRQFTNSLQLQPQDFIDIVLAVLAGLHRGNGVLSMNYQGILRRVYGDRFYTLMASISRDLLGLRQDLAAAPGMPLGRDFEEFTVLHNWPLVRLDDGTLCWWHPMVFAHGIENLVHNRLSEFGADYTRAFSKVFEKYVLELADEAGVPLITEGAYKARLGEQASAVEAIFQCADCNVLVESKMALYPEVLMATDSGEALWQKSKRIREGIGQGAAVAAELAQSGHPFHRSAARDNFLLIVASRELNFGTGTMLQRLFPEKAISYPSGVAQRRLPLDHVFVLSIQTFERLVGALRVDRIDLSALLREAVSANSDPRTAQQFFAQHLGPKVSRYTTPLRMQQVIDASMGRAKTAMEAVA